MKGLKKIALVAAVAAAPFAQAELTSIDDSLLADMTGQAGISIELDTAVTIGSLVYTDTDGHTAGGNVAGSIAVNGIAFGGATVAGGVLATDDARFDNIKIDIDVDANAGIVMHLAAVDVTGALAGTNTADFGLHVDSVTSSAGAGALTLASNINIAGNLGPVDVNINNTTGPGGDLISVTAYFEVVDGGMDVDVMGLGISNLTIGQDSNPFAADTTYGTAGLGLEAVGTGDDNWAKVAMTIGTGSTTVTDPSATTTYDNVLVVSISEMSMDITADLTMGDNAGTALELGSIAINDLDMSSTALKIYGH